MRIEKCWFCSANVYPGKGTKYVRGDYKSFRFCRSKCFKLFKLRLNPRKLKWTKASRVMRGKEVVEHSINTFERRMDVPKMYDRSKVENIIEILPKILDLKNRINEENTKDRIFTAKEKSKLSDLAFMKKYEKLLENEKVIVDTQKLSSSHLNKSESKTKSAGKSKKTSETILN